MNVPNACRYDCSQYALREPTPLAAQVIEQTRLRPLDHEKSAAYSLRTVILTRRWVRVPGRGKGAVWCDDGGRTYGPICFAGQRTTPAPEELAEPEGGW